MPAWNPPCIGGPIALGTAGSVLFVGTGGLFAQDNANLFWDDSNNRLGIGNAAPAGHVHITSLAAGNIPFIIRAHASQSGNLTEWQNSSGTVRSSVSDGGAAQFGTDSGAFNAGTYATLVIGNITGSTADNQALIAAGRDNKSNHPFSAFGSLDDGSIRYVLLGGGGFGTPDATNLRFYTCSTYNETNDQATLKLDISTTANFQGTAVLGSGTLTFNAVQASGTLYSFGGGTIPPSSAWTNLKSSEGSPILDLYNASDVLMHRFAVNGTVTWQARDAATNSVTTIFTLGHNTSGTAAAGYGSRERFTLESSTTEDREALDLDVTWATATDASRKARAVWSVYDTAAREALRIEASGSAAMIGFLGATAVVKATSTTDLRQALIDYGLYTTGGATPLNLNGGALTAGTVAASLADAATNAISTVVTTDHVTSGTAANGFGSRELWSLEDDGGTLRNSAALEVSWATAASATRKARIVVSPYDTAAREALRLEASGSAAMIGVLGAAAVVRQASGADLTNNVTSGGSDNVIANYTSLTTYSTDAAAIRNNIYQLARKLKQVNDALRLYGWLT